MILILFIGIIVFVIWWRLFRFSTDVIICIDCCLTRIIFIVYIYIYLGSFIWCALYVCSFNILFTYRNRFFILDTVLVVVCMFVCYNYCYYCFICYWLICFFIIVVIIPEIKCMYFTYGDGWFFGGCHN